MAKNNEPIQPIPITGQQILRLVNGVTFPSVEFDGVPVDLADDPSSKFSFVVGPTSPSSNVWIHAVDARTFNPAPVVPTGITTSFRAGELDARIQIVWPHDAAGQSVPVSQAEFVNIAVDIFAHGTLQSVPVGFQPTILDLSAAVNNGPPAAIPFNQGPDPLHPSPQQTIYTVNGQTYPRWVFNDVPVQPSQQYHFLASVFFGKLLSPYSSIWTHAADARTLLPSPQIPPPCTP